MDDAVFMRAGNTMPFCSLTQILLMVDLVGFSVLCDFITSMGDSRIFLFLAKFSF